MSYERGLYDIRGHFPMHSGVKEVRIHPDEPGRAGIIRGMELSAFVSDCDRNAPEAAR